MNARLFSPFALLVLAGCPSPSEPEPASVRHEVAGWIEYFYQGAAQPVKVLMHTPVLGVGQDATVYVVTYAEGCYEPGPTIVLSNDGLSAEVVPRDVSVVSYPLQPCAAGLREHPHPVLIHPTVPRQFMLRITGRAPGVDTLVTREIPLQVR